MYLLIIAQCLTSLHLKVCRPIQEWLESRCTDWRVQQEWCLFSCKFLWKRAPANQHTSERDFALWVMANCKSSILPTPSLFPLFRNFLHAVPKLPGGFNPEKWCTDRWNLSGRKQWKGWMCFLSVLLTLWALQVTHWQPITNTFSLLWFMG